MEIKIEHIYPQSNSARIEKQLEELDEYFIPQLSKRINICEYAIKLSRHAHIFYAVYGDVDCGHCAAYANNEEYAFISSIGVDNKYQNNNIGTLLVSSLKEYCIQISIKEIKLEVYERNLVAVAFYEKNGFNVTAKRNQWYEMSCLL